MVFCIVGCMNFDSEIRGENRVSLDIVIRFFTAIFPIHDCRLPEDRNLLLRE